MRRRAYTLTLSLMAVFVLLGAVSSVAGAWVTLPPGVTPVEAIRTGGGLVKLSDGTFAEYADSTTNHIFRLFSGSQEQAIMRRLTAVQVESGVTGNVAADVNGMTAADIAASDAMHAELAGQGAADTAQGLVDSVTSGSRLLGLLPSGDAMVAALAGVTQYVILPVTAAAVGVAVGTGIDELLGLPTLFKTEPEIEKGCLYGGTSECSEVLTKIDGREYLKGKTCNSEWIGKAGPAIPGFCETYAHGASEVIEYTYHGEVHEEKRYDAPPEGKPTYYQVYSPFQVTLPPYPMSSYEDCTSTFSGGDCLSYITKHQVRDRSLPKPDSEIKPLEEHTVTVEKPTIPEELRPKHVTEPFPSREPTLPEPLVPRSPPQFTPEEEHWGAQKSPDLLPNTVPGELPEPKPGEVPSPDPLYPEILPIKPLELGTTYKSELETAGYTDVEIHTLPDTSSDPRTGPGDATAVHPQQGTRNAPATKVDVNVNPSDSPVPELPGGIQSPTIGGVKEPELKLPHFGVLCTGFPFGVPCWLIKTIEAWSASPVAPKLGLGSFTIDGHTIPATSFDLAKLEPIMEKVRPAMLIFATIGLVLLFYNFAKGGSPPSGGSGDSGGSQTYAEEQGSFMRDG